MNLKRLLGLEPKAPQATAINDARRLGAKVRDLEERLRGSEALLRERTEALYAVQRQYSVEHFELAESMRNLKIERMRNAGAYAAQDILRNRYLRLQRRIAELKRRLRAHETVEDLDEDDAPIVTEQEA